MPRVLPDFTLMYSCVSALHPACLRRPPICDLSCWELGVIACECILVKGWLHPSTVTETQRTLSDQSAHPWGCSPLRALTIPCLWKVLFHGYCTNLFMLCGWNPPYVQPFNRRLWYCLKFACASLTWANEIFITRTRAHTHTGTWPFLYISSVTILCVSWKQADMFSLQFRRLWWLIFANCFLNK